MEHNRARLTESFIAGVPDHPLTIDRYIKSTLRNAPNSPPIDFESLMAKVFII
jgi:hypothetical protein